MNQQNSRKAPRTKRNHLDGWTKVWRSANLLIGCICLSGSIAHAQKNPVTMQPAQQPTTVTPSSQPQLGATQAALCMLAECNKPPKPAIGGIDPSSTITPGGQMVVTGIHFNSNDQKNGDIVLTIGSKLGMTRQVMNNPVYLQPYKEAHLKVLGWSDGHAWGEIPGDISGVMDGPASVQIRRSDGMASDPYSVQFTAARAYDNYPASDMKWDTCSQNGDENQCNGWSDFNNPFTKLGSSVLGFHVKFLKNGTPESGTDYYKFSLKNGWVWDQQKWTVWWPSCNTDSFSEEIYDSTPTGGKIKIPWQAGCQVLYEVSVAINGPRGVPWK